MCCQRSRTFCGTIFLSDKGIILLCYPTFDRNAMYVCISKMSMRLVDFIFAFYIVRIMVSATDKKG